MVACHDGGKQLADLIQTLLQFFFSRHCFSGPLCDSKQILGQRHASQRVLAISVRAHVVAKSRYRCTTYHNLHFIAQSASMKASIVFPMFGIVGQQRRHSQQRRPLVSPQLR
jgi:hypothetical protein